MGLTQSKVNQIMKDSDIDFPSRQYVVCEYVCMPTDEDSRRSRLIRDLDTREPDLGWVSNYRDWDDFFRDCKEILCKPVHWVKHWFFARRG